MARGPKKHLKRIAAPSHWMLDKLSGVYAPKPSTGPHKLHECIPLMVILRDTLKYALTYEEAVKITMQRLVKVDGKIRTDHRFPVGFMDVVQIEQSKENFRIFYDTKGRFNLHRIRAEEATYKLCRVKKIDIGPEKVPRAVTSDGRTIRYIHPDVKVNDTVRVDLDSGKVLDVIKFDIGSLVMVTGGRNIGRIGTLIHREKYPGSFEIVHIKDSRDSQFATRISNVFVIGTAGKPWVSLPTGSGIKLSVIEDRAKRLAYHSQ